MGTYHKVPIDACQHKSVSAYRVFSSIMQDGEIDGRVDEVWTHSAAIFFTFIGAEEGEEISGAAANVSYSRGRYDHRHDALSLRG